MSITEIMAFVGKINWAKVFTECKVYWATSPEGRKILADTSTAAKLRDSGWTLSKSMPGARIHWPGMESSDERTKQKLVLVVPLAYTDAEDLLEEKEEG